MGTVTTLAEIWVAVHPDTAKTGAELNTKLGKVDTSKAGKKAGDDYSKGFGTGIKSVVGLAAGALAALKVKDFLKESTDGYRAHLKIAAVTNQVIKTTGKAAKVSAGQVGALADAVELKTGVDGDAIQSGANLLLTFTNVRNEVGKGNQIFNRSTALLADMSVALGQDAKGSAIQLGKALNDPVKGVTALSKVGVSFTETQKKQIKSLVAHNNVLGAQKIILAELNKEFGGAAAAAADPADRATVAYHQLQDQIGEGTLPVVNSLALTFADLLAPALSDIATKHGPKVSAFLADLGPKIGATFALLLTGDFNGKIRKALGGLEEDSGYVGGILTVRDSLLSVKGVFDILVAGNFTSRIFGQEEDSKFVDYLFRAHEGLAGVYEVFRLLATGDFRTRIFGFEEDSPFIGFLFSAREELGKLGESVKSADTSELKTQFFSAADSIGKLLPLLGELKGMIPGVSDVIGGSVTALGFLADHTEQVRQILPFVAAGFIAYKAAQAAANVAALLSVPTKIAEVAVNRSLVKSNRELIASRIGDTAASAVNTAATGTNTAAKSAGILTTIRARAVTLAQAAATGIATVATTVASVAMRGLGIAVRFALGPVGLIITGISLLVAGLIYAYTHFEGFRKVVDSVMGFVARVTVGAFKAVVGAVKSAIDWVKGNWPLLLAILTGPIGLATLFIVKHWDAIKDAGRAAFAFVVRKFLDLVGSLISGAAKAFGWVPGIGPKLKDAAAKFEVFKKDVNTKLSGIQDQEITVTAKLNSANINSKNANDRRLAGGGKVDGPGTTTSDSVDARLSRKEWVIKAKSSMKYGDYAMASVNAGTATILPGYAKGGRPGLSVKASLPSANGLAQSLAAEARAIARPVAQKLADELGAGLFGTMAWGKSQAGKPYGWGASGPSSYDCSGFVSALINYAKGRNPYRRLGATGSMPWSDMASGRGNFMVGYFKGNPGHTAATINGVNFESAGGVGVRYGRSARGADSSLFTNQMKVKGFAEGGRPGLEGRRGDLPFDLVDRRGKAFLGKKELAQMGIKTYDGGGRWPSGTLGANLSGKTETVTTGGDTMTVRLSDEDRQLLRDAGARPITLDGRRLDEGLTRETWRY